jgi:Cu(I)/Ag(I) efflux system membrane protein CusA/SilA
VPSVSAHLRSALVAIVTLPIGILAAFIVMHYQGVNANIMSLGGIAIAIGAMVDAAVVMIENAHRKLEFWGRDNATPEHKRTGRAPRPTNKERWAIITEASVQVVRGSQPAHHHAVVPPCSRWRQALSRHSPTKTYAMAAAAILAVTLVPVLMGYVIRGRIPRETANPLNRLLIAIYRPLLRGVLRWPKVTLLFAVLLVAATYWPITHVGGEFMPPLDEGDLLYMPTTCRESRPPRRRNCCSRPTNDPHRAGGGARLGKVTRGNSNRPGTDEMTKPRSS